MCLNATVCVWCGSATLVSSAVQKTLSYSMEVVSSNDGLLTNIEVLEVLKENRARRGNTEGAKIDLQNRENVETKAVKYISNSIIGKLSSSTVGECISKIKKLGLGLTEGEIVQIANLAPESDVELYLIIEECSNRCTDDQLAEIREIVSSTYAPFKSI